MLIAGMIRKFRMLKRFSAQYRQIRNGRMKIACSLNWNAAATQTNASVSLFLSRHHTLSIRKQV